MYLIRLSDYLGSVFVNFQKLMVYLMTEFNFRAIYLSTYLTLIQRIVKLFKFYVLRLPIYKILNPPYITNYHLFSDCIIAPYEADAQLAFLVKSGIVDMIITEDSDLTLFGCDKVLFKLEHQSGNGVLVWGILQIRGNFDKKS